MPLFKTLRKLQQVQKNSASLVSCSSLLREVFYPAVHSSPIKNMACPGTLKRLRCFRMKEITIESKGVWSNASNEAPWQICNVSAHGKEWRPESLSLSSKSYFKLEEKRGQKSPQCKGGHTKDRMFRKLACCLVLFLLLKSLFNSNLETVCLMVLLRVLVLSRLYLVLVFVVCGPMVF
ncbi:hypothetical protein DY000_02047658 [Brassica cretica]|uniref:Uncharacterized protein n=1 Tax=Brassica cretica TaxID=69181 RepID=A0ABQ7EPW0_BRACR|nr:hypothetical protein DY000_02047658 [Brassica cretica]